ncbi:MAG: hypothetical protein ACLFRB_01300, partial [Thiohalorhabdus sp.]|uniref:hypothetical protein n=1 Tax=Thiohalorhabdus sp. TaxID=3094134 RepID=UPI00397EF8B8
MNPMPNLPVTARLCEAAYGLLRRLVPRWPGAGDRRRALDNPVAPAGRPRLWLHAGTRAGLA